MSIPLIIQYDTKRRSCICSIQPTPYCPVESMALEVMSLNRKIIVTALLPIDQTELHQKQLCISGVYAHHLKLAHNELVICSPLDPCSITHAESVELVPASIDDWEIIESNISIIENTLLDQIRVLNQNQIFPVWASNMCLFVEMARSYPDDSTVVISQRTKVLVRPVIGAESICPKSELNHDQSVDNTINFNNSFNIFHIFQHAQSIQTPSHICVKVIDDLKIDCTRAQITPPLIICRSCNIEERWMMASVSISKTDENEEFYLFPTVLTTIDRLAHFQINIAKFKNKLIYVTDDYLLYAPVWLRKADEILFEPLQRLNLNLVECSFSNVCSKLRCITNDDTLVRDTIIRYLSKYLPCSNSNLILLPTFGAIISLNGETGTHQILMPDRQLTKHTQTENAETQNQLPYVVIRVDENLTIDYACKNDPIQLGDLEEPLTNERPANYKNISYFQNVLQSLIDSVLRSKRNTLLTGSVGSGKSTILKEFSYLIRKDLLINTESIDCRTLRGKKVDDVLKRIENCIDRCRSFDPSILILENIDAILSIEQTGAIDAAPGQLLTLNKLAHSLTYFVMSSGVRLLVTSRSPSVKLHSTLRAFNRKGSLPSIIEESIHIVDPDDTARRQFFDGSLSEKQQELVNVTCGFTIGDLARLQQRASIAANMTGRDYVTFEDYQTTLPDFVPLKGARLNKDFDKNDISWTTHVGGMMHVKMALEKAIVWPTKYSSIYDQCGVRKPKGVLLYGRSGTGKTLAARAIAADSGLTIINIRGPELLSKYIGESEQSVRQLFERARSARPSVIVFDELDSLAPQRGHDSTGVTDRVVNQLLTELDGIEGLNGVSVIGTTSRTDMIDKALLRPGRLDVHVECTIPNCDDIDAIMKIHMNDSDHYVITKRIIDAMRGFTGAQIKLTLTDAYMSEAAISEDALMKAISNTKQSTQSRNTNHNYDLQSECVGLKATLA